MKSKNLPEDMQTRLVEVHKDSLEIIRGNVPSSEALLEKIALTACQHSASDYAAAGISSKQNTFKKLACVQAGQQNIQSIKKLPKDLCDFSQTLIDKEIKNLFIENLAILSIPINIPGRHIGQIILFRNTDSGEYTADDQAIMEILSSYAATALSNQYLSQNLSERDTVLTKRNENLALLNELATTLSSTDEIELMLEKALAQVMAYLHLEAGGIFLRQEDNITLTQVFHQDTGCGNIWSKDEFEINEGIVGRTAFYGEPQFIDLSQNDSDPFLSEDAVNKGIIHINCFPLNAGSEILGVLSIANDHNESLDELELQFLSIICSWIGTVIDNARLNLQQRRLAVLEERERIGMDLHDGVIQSIYAVGLTLEHARLLLTEDIDKAQSRIVQAVADLNVTIRDIRSYILDLRPHHLHEENLLQGIQRLIKEFQANTLVEVNLQGYMDDFKDLPNAQALALFHICQEALANIAKHARAKKVEVTLWATADRALMEVHDNGRGFDLKKIKFTLGHGLSNMQTRARNVGGEVDITSEPGSGTTTLAWVPFPRVIMGIDEQSANKDN